MFAAEIAKPDLSGIRLFGSSIRGEIDDHSDRDLLVLVQGSVVSTRVQQLIHTYDVNAYDVSVYTENRYREMHQSGHLFTWHVYHESAALDETLMPAKSLDLIDRLGAPALYKNAEIDRGALLGVLCETLDSISNDECSEVYEAGLLYIVARNLAIIESWRLGSLCFSVRAPYFVSARSGLTFPLSAPTYDLLRCCRKASAGVSLVPQVARSELCEWAAEIEKWSREIAFLTNGDSNV